MEFLAARSNSPSEDVLLEPRARDSIVLLPFNGMDFVLLGNGGGKELLSLSGRDSTIFAFSVSFLLWELVLVRARSEIFLRRSESFTSSSFRVFSRTCDCFADSIFCL